MPDKTTTHLPPPPEVIRTLAPGQAVLWCGERVVVASYHPFRGLRLQGPDGGPSFYAEARECAPVEDEAAVEPG